MIPSNHQFNRITLHHSASPVTTTLADIKKWHLERGFGDIGYHFVILPNGVIQTGRGLEWQGAHVSGHNEGNLGICLIGDFTKHDPTEAQYQSSRAVVAELMNLYAIPCG